MKIALAAAVLVHIFISFAHAGTCDSKCSVALNQLKEHVADLSKVARRDNDCPKSGIEVLTLDKEITGGLLSAESSSLPKVNAFLKARESELNNGKSKCGVCNQKNQTSLVLNTFPKTKSQSTQFCEGRPTQVLTHEFNSIDDAKSYVISTMKGNGEEGKNLLRQCPDPCSFYIMSATTQLPNKHTRLNLSVRCDQPREGMAIFADYLFSGNWIHEWSCSKK